MFMKKLGLLIICAIFPICVIAQQQTEYNKRGDEAMKRRDFSDARLFYGQGVPNCDMYSIHQLTRIWMTNEKMRTSMYNVMRRCFNCLVVKAEENDTTAISKVILYYSEGIGTSQNDQLAAIWSKKLDEIRNPIIDDNTVVSKERMKFFAGYTFSPLAPVGFTVGGVGKRFGWYTRFKTNTSFQSFEGEFSGEKPGDMPEPNKSLKQKANTYSVTAGLVVKCTPWLYTSLGAGYGKRDLLRLYSLLDDKGGIDPSNQIWYKKTDSSYNGASVELDFIVKLGTFYLTAGCNTLNFEYIDLNAGAGVFF